MSQVERLNVTSRMLIVNILPTFIVSCEWASTKIGASMKLVTKVYERGISISGFLAGGIIIFIWGVTIAEVTLRKLVNYSIPWGIELSEFGLMAATFFGAAWLLKKEGHIKIDIMTNQLSPRGNALLSTITSIIGVAICLFLAWYGTKVTVDHFQRGVTTVTVMRWITWPRYAVITLGSFLLLVQFCRRAFANLRLWRMPQDKDVAPGEGERVKFKQGGEE